MIIYIFPHCKFLHSASQKKKQNPKTAIVICTTLQCRTVEEVSFKSITISPEQQDYFAFPNTSS